MAKLSSYLPTKPLGANGFIQFKKSGKLSGDANLFWDDLNIRLGIGTNSPTEGLDISNSGGLRLGDTSYENAGTIRFTGSTFQGYDGTAWVTLATSGGTTSPGGSNRYIQYNDNGSFGGDASLIWNETSNRLGIGTTSPETQVELVSTAWATQHGLSVTQYSSTPIQSGNIYLKHSRGTPASPSYTASGDQLGSIEFGGYSEFASGCVTGAIIKARTTQDWSAGNTYGSELAFSTIADGATVQSERLTIGQDGRITLEFGTGINEFSIDGTLVGDSDDALPTEKAVKAYVDTSIASIPDATSHWTLTGVDLYYNDGDVGIGTTTPRERLDLQDSFGSGGLVVGEHESFSPSPGTLEWDGYNFRGYDGTNWLELDSQGGGGGSTSPGGLNTQVQYNDNGSFGGADVYWDDGNTRLGIGTSTPSDDVHLVVQDAVASYKATAYSTTGGHCGHLRLQKARGSEGSPSAVLNGDVLANLAFQGYGASDFGNGVRLLTYTDQNWTDSAHGAYFIIQTTPNNSTTLTSRLTVASDGFVGIGTITPDADLEIERNNAVPNIMLTQTSIGSLEEIGSIKFKSDTYESVILEGRTSAGQNFGELRIRTMNGTGLTEGIRVTQNGNVGISGVDPGSNSLSVNGNAFFNGSVEVDGGYLTAHTQNAWIIGRSDDNSIQAGFGGRPASGYSGAYVGSLTNHALHFMTNSSIDMILTTAGYLGIGYTYPAQVLERLDVNGAVRLGSTNNANAGTIRYNGDFQGYKGGAWVSLTAAGGATSPGGSDTQVQYNNGGAFGGAASIIYDDALGYTGLGSSPATRLHVEGSGNDAATVTIRRTSANASPPYVSFGKSRSGSIIQDGDYLGGVVGKGWDGAAYQNAGGIFFRSNGTPSAGDMPGSMEFYTTAVGGTTWYNRMTIGQDGKIAINSVDPQGNVHVAEENDPGSIWVSAHSATDVHSGQIHLAKSRGTEASPTNILDGDRMGLIVGRGYVGASGWGGGSRLSFNATEDWVTSPAWAMGSDISFETILNGTTTVVERMKIDHDGKVYLGSGTGINEFSTDGTLAGNSDDAVPTEKAVKTYVTNAIIDSTGGGGVTPPGGSDGEIQYNNGGSFGGSSLIFNDSNDTLSHIGPYMLTFYDDGNSYVGSRAHTNTAEESGIVQLSRARGTRLSPTKVLSGDALGKVQSGGFYTSDYATSSYIQFTASEDWDSENELGCDIEFFTVDSGDSTSDLCMTLAGDGKLSLTSGTGINEFSTDGTFVGNSDDVVPTEKAIKTYIEGLGYSTGAYIDQSGGTSDTYGSLSGAVDGTNSLFVVSEGSYTSGSLRVHLNGQLLTQGSSEDWVEETPASGSFSFTTPPDSGDEVTAIYGGSGISAKMITSPMTVNVPSDFPTLQDAMDWVEASIVLADITIQLADNTYNFASGEFHEFRHPNYAHVSVQGNTSTPSNVTLNYHSGTNVCMWILNGTSLRGLHGVKITGGTFGILVDRASKLVHMVDCEVTATASVGVWCRDMSFIGAIRVNSHTNANYGYYCYGNAEIYAMDPTSSNNNVGFYVDTGGTIRTTGTVTMSGNTSNYNVTLNTSSARNGLVTTF